MRSDQRIAVAQRYMWTEERDDIIRRDWPTKATVHDVQAKLAALPGPRILTMAIYRRAKVLGVVRPPRDDTHLEKLNTLSSQPIAADFDQVRRWAAEKGVRFDTWEDLPAVNDARDRIFLPTFKRLFPTRGRYG